MKKLFAVAVAVCMMLALLAGCGNGSNSAPDTADTSSSSSAASPAPESSAPADDAQEPSGEQVTLTFVRTGTPEILREIFEPIIADFEAEHPNIKIDMQDLGWSDATQSLQAWAASETLPDVMYHLPGTIFDLADKGLILDLSSYLDDELVNDMYPSMLAAGQYDGAQYMITCGASTITMWYNAELFTQAGLDPDNPPSTWEELLDACEALSKLDGIAPIGLYASPAGGETSFLYESLFTSEYGGSAWDGSGYVYDTEEGKEAAVKTLQFIQDLTAYAQDSYVEYGRFDCRTLLANGNVAIVLDAPNMANQIPDQLADGTMRCALLPAGGSGVSSSAVNVGGWYIPANCEHPDEAWTFLRYLMETENQLAHSTYGSVPILKSEAATYTDGFMATLAQSVENSYAEGICPDTNALWEVNGEQLQLLMMGNQTAEETQANMAAGHADILG